MRSAVEAFLDAVNDYININCGDESSKLPMSKCGKAHATNRSPSRHVVPYEGLMVCRQLLLKKRGYSKRRNQGRPEDTLYP